jgi:hypothetical protein
MFAIIILFDKSAEFVASIAYHICISFVELHPIVSESPHLFGLKFYRINIQ